MARRSRSPFTLYWRDDIGCFGVNFSVAGKRFRLSTSETDRGKAEERATAKWQEARARAGAPIPPGGPVRPLTNLAASLVEQAERVGRAETFARDLEVDLRIHILPRWPSAAAVTTTAWKLAMHDLHADGQSWRSVQRIGKHLRALLRYAEEHGAISSVPEIRSPPRALIVAEQADRAAFTRAERDALLDDMRKRGNRRAYRCYTVMFFNLLRKSSVERLCQKWIDRKTRSVTFPPGSYKNRRPFRVWLHPRSWRAIQDQIGECGSIDPNEPIFGKFDHSNVFWAACKRLGLVEVKGGEIVDKRGLTAHHVARHTGNTLLGDTDATESDRMAAGGWETAEAMRKYDHVDVERSKRALGKLR